ncbi:unnamed protein product [Anisakis simplex]|uniref:ribonuclease Z n=1 Tax=Anisakis simplex TaxID=6269 RepID=A0A3P6SQG4_ANISI|nr:unnamed protein product [Anisakis simplex]
MQKLVTEIFAVLSGEFPRGGGLIIRSCQFPFAVLSNGSTHLRPCVVIRTPQKVYLFNCPEGTTRFLPSLRLKSLNVCDIFVTRGTWDHIGGISSVLLSKEKGAQSTRLHGAVDIRHFLECIRPFADSDFAAARYPTQVINSETTVEERSLEMGGYKDAALTIHYLPVSGLQVPSFDEITSVNLNEPVKPIQGPDDVLFSVSDEEDPNLLIVECVDNDAIQSLRDNSLLQKYMNGEKMMNYVVHFTSNELFESKEYEAWMQSFGSQCMHIVLNGSGPCLPHVESIYRNHAILNRLNSDLFPQLVGSDFDGVITQDDECERRQGNRIYARPIQRFALRGKCKSVECSIETPRISFLGTSSAVPSKYRNVSGYLVQLSDSSSIMVDCGEGSYGQMRVLFGDERCDEVLISLNAIFVTHAHLDHINGLYTVILRRHEAFMKKGLDYRPLVLACNFNVLNPFKTYSRCFCNLEPLVIIANISTRSPVSRDRSNRCVYLLFFSAFYGDEELLFGNS